MADANQQDSIGIKISKPFYNVLTAADNELLFSSSFPSLAVAFETTVALDGSVAFQTFSADVPHNLGFPPLCMGWKVVSGISKRVFPRVTKTGMKFENIPGENGSIHLVCYALDLSTPATFPIINPAQSSPLPYNPDYGIKVSKKGKDVSSPDLRDFILHSRAPSPLIYKVATEASDSINVGGQDRVSVTPPSGYIAWVFGYGKFHNTSPYTTDDQWVFAPPRAQATPRLFLDVSLNNFYVPYSAASPNNGSTIVVLRDPLFAPTEVSVVY